MQLLLRDIYLSEESKLLLSNSFIFITIYPQNNRKILLILLHLLSMIILQKVYHALTDKQHLKYLAK